MEKWISSLIILTLLRTSSNQQNNYGCSYEILLTNEKQIICINITTSFLQYSNINLNRSSWFLCKNCNLSTITTNTFNFPKNSINRLILIDNNIDSVSNRSFVKLPFLKILNLKKNVIKSLNKNTFEGIQKLLQLDLSRNMLEKLEDQTFSNLENLDILNLNQNCIRALSTNTFEGLKNLKYLYLNSNKIMGLSALIFERMVNLKILYLEHNRIEEIHPWAFNGLLNLNYLYLNNNSISGLVQYHFKPLISLVDLQLRQNHLTLIDTSTFNGLKNIKYLYLGDNHIDTIKSYGLIGLNSLEVLDFIGNSFENFSLSYFKDMENLRVVWLEDNNIINFTVSSHTDIQKSLRIINLEKNRLEFVNYKLLHEKVPRLDELWIGGNNWTCDFIIEMQDYFFKNNVTICASKNCSKEAAKNYIESICFEPYENETDIVDPAVTDCGNGVNSCILIVVFTLVIDFCASTSL